MQVYSFTLSQTARIHMLIWSCNVDIWHETSDFLWQDKSQLTLSSPSRMP